MRRHTLDLLCVICLKCAVLDAGDARPEVCAQVGDPVGCGKERGRLCDKTALQGSRHLGERGLRCLGLLVWQSAKPARNNAEDLVNVLMLQAGVCAALMYVPCRGPTLIILDATQCGSGSVAHRMSHQQEREEDLNGVIIVDEHGKKEDERSVLVVTGIVSLDVQGARHGGV